MTINIVQFITDCYVLVFVSVILGILIGRIEFGRFNLGTSGCLFVGILISYILQNANINSFLGIQKDFQIDVPEELFTFSLILFIAAVGLGASHNLLVVLKKYGIKFIILSAIITGFGALSCLVTAMVFKGYNAFSVLGVFNGAMTSTPGLASAMETVADYGDLKASLVGSGYAIAYIPGVILVIIAVKLIPLIFNINIEEEKRAYELEITYSKSSIAEGENKSIAFDIRAFMFVCCIGFFIDKIKVYLGQAIGDLSLGITGGVLIAALICGCMGNILSMNFRMDKRILATIRELALSMFLAIIGLKNGFSTINVIFESGWSIFLMATLCCIVAIMSGFIIGRYFLKLNWVLLSGSICGGMTSTPGLGAAIDALDSDIGAVGYGATYPFALIMMIIWTIVLKNTLI